MHHEENLFLSMYVNVSYLCCFVHKCDMARQIDADDDDDSFSSLSLFSVV